MAVVGQRGWITGDTACRFLTSQYSVYKKSNTRTRCSVRCILLPEIQLTRGFAMNGRSGPHWSATQRFRSSQPRNWPSEMFLNTNHGDPNSHTANPSGITIQSKSPRENSRRRAGMGSSGCRPVRMAYSVRQSGRNWFPRCAVPMNRSYWS
jgi:hypothetical protein